MLHVTCTGFELVMTRLSTRLNSRRNFEIPWEFLDFLLLRFTFIIRTLGGQASLGLWFREFLKIHPFQRVKYFRSEIDNQHFDMDYISWTINYVVYLTLSNKRYSDKLWRLVKPMELPNFWLKSFYNQRISSRCFKTSLSFMSRIICSGLASGHRHKRS